MRGSLIAGIEAGGTKTICAVAAGDGSVLAQCRVPTGSPDETFAAIAAFYDEQKAQRGPIEIGGVGSFGPLDLDPRSPMHGALTTTPKPDWSGTNMRSRVSAILGAPVLIDTDVNCAGLAEGVYGAGQGLDRFCYVTVGTGIGVGCIDDGRPSRGVGHPEAGHMRITRAAGDDAFAGICPYHSDCLEGLASGPAIEARWWRKPQDLGEGHNAWRYEAHYIAALAVNLTYVLRPQRIILGGGVMSQTGLIDLVRSQFDDMMAGYSFDRWSGDPATYLAEPMLTEPSAGLVGAIELARRSGSDFSRAAR